MDEELREWLGIKPADVLVYLAVAAIVGMYFNRGIRLDVVLSILSVAFGILACFKGMKRDDRLSGVTNFAKLTVYPLCLIGVVAFVVVNFLWWNW